MKHQYFGDENDYRKYGLLRALSGRGALSTGVWWMLTEDDRSSDGNFTRYLHDETARRHDPELFDHLKRSLATGRRHLDHVEKSEVLPMTSYFTDVVPDKLSERNTHVRQMREVLGKHDLLFFDPDNGIEVKSKPPGTKDSSKFVRWSELADAFRAGQSVLVYQHFPRRERTAFISSVATELGMRTGARCVDTFASSRVLFILARQLEHDAILTKGINTVATSWRGQLSHVAHEVT